jgi:hypothetical protein
VRIDPHGWWFTLPLLAGLFWTYFQPANHVVKEFFRHLVRTEAQGLATLGIGLWSDEARTRRAYNALFWATSAALALSTLLSFGAYLGLLPGH